MCAAARPYFQVLLTGNASGIVYVAALPFLRALAADEATARPRRGQADCDTYSRIAEAEDGLLPVVLGADCSYDKSPRFIRSTDSGPGLRSGRVHLLVYELCELMYLFGELCVQLERFR